MRQLVSVSRDGSLSYFVADGDDVQQIAQVLDLGLDVTDIIGLGNVLTDALRLNGKHKRALKQPEPVVSVATTGEQLALDASSEPERRSKPKSSTVRSVAGERAQSAQRAQAAQRREREIALLVERPGLTTAELCDELGVRVKDWGNDTQRLRQQGRLRLERGGPGTSGRWYAVMNDAPQITHYAEPEPEADHELIEIVRARPGSPVAVVADVLGIGYDGAYKRLRKARDAGHVRSAETDTHANVWYVTNTGDADATG